MLHAPPWISGSTVVGEPPDMGRVLVVDDSRTNRRLLGGLLERLGHEVATAGDGAAALEILRAGADIDVVLLDIMMPVLGGVETLGQLKEDTALHQLPVIMISAVEELDTVIRCIELGAADYLPKPVDPAVLGARLRSSLAAKRLRDVELDYLRQVRRVIDAAASVEAGRYESAALAPVADRVDALGQLARTFQRMAAQVGQREAALRQELGNLRIELDSALQRRRVTEITDSDYFVELNEQAAQLKTIMGTEPPPTA